MKHWLERNAQALQSLGTLVTMVAAVAALIGVKVQIEANARQQREQSARDIYREFLNLSVSKPEFASPDYCAISGTAVEGAYEDYVEYLLYTSEQLMSVSSEWEPTLFDHLEAHSALLCARTDWSDDTPQVRQLMERFQAEKCASVKPVNCGAD